MSRRLARRGAVSLLSPEPAPAFVARIDKEYEIARDQHARKQPRPSRSLAHARANRHQLDCGL
jgi:5-methyltetrahydrofolate--homocysteine methyltransferase